MLLMSKTNVVENKIRENAGNQRSRLFLRCSLLCTPFEPRSMASANDFNFDKTTDLSFGKELTTRQTKINPSKLEKKCRRQSHFGSIDTI